MNNWEVKVCLYQSRDQRRAKKEFISRCLRDPNINKEFKTQEQRITVCYSIWAQEKN